MHSVSIYSIPKYEELGIDIIVHSTIFCIIISIAYVFTPIKKILLLQKACL